MCLSRKFTSWWCQTKEKLSRLSSNLKCSWLCLINKLQIAYRKFSACCNLTSKKITLKRLSRARQRCDREYRNLNHSIIVINIGSPIHSAILPEELTCFIHLHQNLLFSPKGSLYLCNITPGPLEHVEKNVV